MVAISTLLLVVAISLLITRVATVILTATGISRESAKFQARSAFTSSGFTTRESEAVVDHPIRRRVIGTLMLIGSAGTVAVVSTLILGLGKGGGGGQPWWRVLELVLGLLAIVAVSRSKRVDQRMTLVIQSILRRYTQLPTRDVASLLELTGDYAVSELAVAANDWMANRSLSDLALRDEGVVVLGLTRKDGRYIAAPTGATTVHEGDILVVYGRDEHLHELDNRNAGDAGDRAHAAAVRLQEHLELSEGHDQNLAER